MDANTVSVLMPVIDAIVKIAGVVIACIFANSQHQKSKAVRLAAMVDTLDTKAEAAVAASHRMTGAEVPLSMAGPDLVRVHAAQDQLALDKLRVTAGPTMARLRKAGERADAIAVQLIAKHAVAHQARAAAARGSLVPAPVLSAPEGV